MHRLALTVLSAATFTIPVGGAVGLAVLAAVAAAAGYRGAFLVGLGLVVAATLLATVALLRSPGRTLRGSTAGRAGSGDR